mmetsp:Transcript_54042/g.135895  ORF Transcript_54042/g.135895 Transcript_54042/m.135895 type:complete len:287 (+) Transcript_54042:345-1205(+)
MRRVCGGQPWRESQPCAGVNHSHCQPCAPVPHIQLTYHRCCAVGGSPCRRFAWHPSSESRCEEVHIRAYSCAGVQHFLRDHEPRCLLGRCDVQYNPSPVQEGAGPPHRQRGVPPHHLQNTLIRRHMSVCGEYEPGVLHSRDRCGAPRCTARRVQDQKSQPRADHIRGPDAGTILAVLRPGGHLRGLPDESAPHGRHTTQVSDQNARPRRAIRSHYQPQSHADRGSGAPGDGLCRAYSMAYHTLPADRLLSLIRLPIRTGSVDLVHSGSVFHSGAVSRRGHVVPQAV